MWKERARKSTTALLFFVAALLVVQTASAQEQSGEEQTAEKKATEAGAYSMHGEEREGFWISFGLGLGSMGASGGTNRVGGGTTMVELGGTISPRLLVGGGIHAWTRDEITIGTVTGLARFYPTDDHDFYLLGGLGIGVGEDRHGEYEGGGLILGVGYDVSVGTSWNVTPNLTSAAASFEPFTVNIVQLGVAMTYH